MVGLSIRNGRSDEETGFDTDLRDEPAGAPQGQGERDCWVMEDEVFRRARRQKQHFVSATDLGTQGPARFGARHSMEKRSSLRDARFHKDGWSVAT